MRKITPLNNNGSMRIRFTHKGQRYNLGLKGLNFDSKTDYAEAQAVAARIMADIDSGNFDSSLKKYQTVREWLAGELTLLEAFDLWSAASGASDSTIHTHHKYVRETLEGDRTLDGLSPSIYNRRIGLMQQAREWALIAGYRVKSSPYDHLKLKKLKPTKIKPFSQKELTKILSAIDTVKPHYRRFTEFLIVSGCRVGEAIALRGQDVCSNPPIVSIGATYSRKDDGYTRELKEATKTGSIRSLHSPQLVEIALRDGPVDPESFVFTSATGRVIDYTYYRKEVWKPALALAGVTYRNIHTLRHTALSMALEKGLTPPQVAGIAGHANSTMVNRTYGHIITRPDVPEIEL